MVLDGPGQQDQVLERVAAAGLRGHAPAVEQRPQRARGLVEPVEPLADAPPEVDASGPVLELEPGRTQAGDRAALADVVERRERLRDDERTAERDRPDEQPQPDALRDLRQRREGAVALPGRLLGLADDPVDVIPRPDMVVAELLRTDRPTLELGPRRLLVPQDDPEGDGPLAHPGRVAGLPSPP